MQVVTELRYRGVQVHRLRRRSEGLPRSDQGDFRLTQKADDLFFGKAFLHVQSPSVEGLDSKPLCYSKTGETSPGRRIPAHRPVVATQRAAPGLVLRLPAGDPQGDLHQQRHRVG